MSKGNIARLLLFLFALGFILGFVVCVALLVPPHSKNSSLKVWLAQPTPTPPLTFLTKNPA